MRLEVLVRPKFGPSIVVKSARHPILDVRERDIIPNDIVSSFVAPPRESCKVCVFSMPIRHIVLH